MKKQSAVESKSDRKEKKDPKEKVNCPECGKVLTRGYLKTHVANIHEPERKEQSSKEATKETTRSYTIPNEPTVSLVGDWEFLEESDESLMNILFGKLALYSPFVSSDAPTQITKDGVKIRDQEEQRVQLKLEKKTGYHHKKCEDGIIDLFSEEDKIIIEIKRWSLYKHALGQLLAYAESYPDYQLQAHFFGPIPPPEELIKRVARFSRHKIQVTWEP